MQTAGVHTAYMYMHRSADETSCLLRAPYIQDPLDFSGFGDTDIAGPRQPGCADSLDHDLRSVALYLYAGVYQGYGVQSNSTMAFTIPCTINDHFPISGRLLAKTLNLFICTINYNGFNNLYTLVGCTCISKVPHLHVPRRRERTLQRSPRRYVIFLHSIPLDLPLPATGYSFAGVFPAIVV